MLSKKSLPLSKVYQLIEPGPVVMVTTANKEKANIMTMAWHMMVDFEPPLIACVISNRNYSFKLLTKSKVCVINIPTVELIKEVVSVGKTTGANIDKFKKFNFTQEAASLVDVPMIKECYANLECKIVDARLAKKYNIFIFEVVKAWITPAKKRPKTIHHAGNGLFIIDGKTMKLPFQSRKNE